MEPFSIIRNVLLAAALPIWPRKSCLGARKRFDSHQDIFVQVFLILSRNLRLEGFLLQSCPDSFPNPLISQDFDFTLWHVFGEIRWPGVIHRRVEHSR